MLRAKAKDAAEQPACRRIFRRRTLRGVASQHSGTGPRRIAGVGADGGVVPLPVENRSSCYRRYASVTGTAQSFVIVNASYFGEAAGAVGTVRGVGGGIGREAGGGEEGGGDGRGEGGRICLAGGSVPLTTTGGGAGRYIERESLRTVAAGTEPAAPDVGCRLTCSMAKSFRKTRVDGPRSFDALPTGRIGSTGTPAIIRGSCEGCSPLAGSRGGRPTGMG